MMLNSDEVVNGVGEGRGRRILAFPIAEQEALLTVIGKARVTQSI
jgi:hypothetical protein